MPEGNEDTMATADAPEATGPAGSPSDATDDASAAETASIPKPRRPRTPAKAAAAKAVPAKAVPAKAVPTKAVPAKGAPTKATPVRAPRKAAGTTTRRPRTTAPTRAALAAAFAPETIKVPATPETTTTPDDRALDVTEPEILPPGLLAMRPPTPPPSEIASKAGRAARRTPISRSRWARIVTGVLVLAFLGLALGVLSSSQLPGSVAGGARSGSPSGSPSIDPGTTSLVQGGTGGADGILVSSTGQALYYNEQDTPTTPLCTGSCARVWVPFTVSNAAALSSASAVLGQLSTVPVAGGALQVAYNGHLLYTFTVDSPGHATGDGTFDLFDGVGFQWHAATISGDTLAPNQPGAPTGVPTPTPGQSPTSPVTPTPTRTPTPTPSPTPSGENPTRGA